MRILEYPIRILTPIWTAGPSQKPDGLKMSGIIGGMRHAFEMLVRKHGGHTCNITGSNTAKRCNYAANPKVCPACQLFGCTGLSRAFKVVLDMPVTAVVFPENDTQIPNRKHDNTPYAQAPSIDTWIASVVQQEGSQILRPQEHQRAQDILNCLRLPYASSTVSLKTIQLRPLPDALSLDHLLTCLLQFMSQYTGLGAKVRQGYGQFLLEDVPDINDEQERILFTSLFNQSGFTENNWDTHLPNGAHCFSREWVVSDTDLGFTWPTQRRGFQCVGYGLRYALRRRIKFFEEDHVGQNIPVTDQNWRRVRHGRPWSTNPGVPWKEVIAFTHALFGRDNAKEDNKHAGLIGVSHAYTHNSTTRLKLFGCIQEHHYRYRNRGAVDDLNWNASQVRDFIIGAFEQELRDRGAAPTQPAQPLQET